MLAKFLLLCVLQPPNCVIPEETMISVILEKHAVIWKGVRCASFERTSFREDGDSENPPSHFTWADYMFLYFPICLDRLFAL